MRFSTRGTTSRLASSTAFWISSSPLLARVSPALMTRARAADGAALQSLTALSMLLAKTSF